MHHEVAPSRLEALRTLEDRLLTEIRGQEPALRRIAAALRRGELGLTKPGRPRGTFLLLGSTGVGKTETVLVATQHLFSTELLFRFDMSEFQTPDSTRLLLGAGPGDEGYLGAMLASARSGSLLFDEIEKAHPRVLDLLLQILDAARITVATGQVLDLSGFHVWLTSNVGSAELLLLQHSTAATLERHVLARAQAAFRPEIFARIAEKIVFGRLGYDVQVEIARKFLERELAFLAGNGHRLEPANDVLAFLVRKGFDARLGARPMRDTIEKLVGDAVSRCLIVGGSANGTLAVDQGEDGLVVKTGTE